VYNPKEFVNRDTEIDVFADMLDHPHLRILFLHGPEGIGKTSLIGRLRQDVATSGAVSVIVDFSDETLSDPEDLLDRLQERLGGEFAACLDQAEFTVLHKFREDSLRELLSLVGSTGFSRVDIAHAEEINIQGDMVGGSKIVLNNSSITLPTMNGDYPQRAIKRNVNRVFPQALKILANSHARAILFFDHFEKAKKISVIPWLRHHLFNLYLEATNEILDVWIVVASREIPYAEEADGWSYVLYNQLLEPLEEKFIRSYWLEKHHLDPDKLRNVIRDCKGIPSELRRLAKEAIARRRGQAT